ncbi:DEAD/DEAH box helicase [Carpediemonas membranifera]|uniref:ATP-dependent RNA helicase n=1 Tax=Carpediemonas membranifera TaxID=201153 RepID=A0A8J6DZT3_9EUKA|nr:DEAD/DEAH box helicase [Carpediemonas membranifera]|eukprot:KAG9391178.1 DEAD/DEAH box helicase [Carpediemonas membranifera]
MSDSKEKYLKSLEEINAVQDGFTEWNINPFLKRNLRCPDRGFGFSGFTDVQQAVVPAVASGNNLIVRAETGSGKTLAYLVPIVNYLANGPFAYDPTAPTKKDRSQGTFAVIVAPTHDLAVQIHEVAEKLTKPFYNIVCTRLVGGADSDNEKKRLRKGVGIIVTTPGRLLYHLKQTANLRANLAALRFLVFDESDRLLDMGFKQVMREILDRLSELSDATARQTLLLSATVGNELESFASSFEGSWKHVLMDDKGDREAYKLPESLKQEYVLIPARKKISTMLALLAAPSSVKSIVFVSTIDIVTYMEKLLNHLTTTATPVARPAEIFALHGNMPSPERADMVMRFSKAERGVLIATDVAARGLDIQHLDLVVQLDAPADVTTYVHRVGRTARQHAVGRAVLFLLPEVEEPFVGALQDSDIEVQKLNLERLLKTSFKKDHRETWYSIQDTIEDIVGKNTELLESARLAYSSWTKAYTVRTRAMRKIFNMHSIKTSGKLGTMCASFGLKESPTEIAAALRMKSEKERRDREAAAKREHMQKHRKNKLGTKVGKGTRDDRRIGMESRPRGGKVKRL